MKAVGQSAASLPTCVASPNSFAKVVGELTQLALNHVEVADRSDDRTVDHKCCGSTPHSSEEASWQTP